MTEFGKPRTYLADNVPGSPPILWRGNEKVELDEETALQWLCVLNRFFEYRFREMVKEAHGRSH